MDEYRETIFNMVNEGHDDFTARQMKLLLLLGDAGPNGLGFSDAFSRMGSGVAKPAVTRAADRLVEAGYLERKPNTTDRRTITMALTKAGREFYQRLLAGMPASRRKAA